MSGRITRFLPLLGFFGCGMGLLMASLFMSDLVDASHKQPLLKADPEFSNAMLIFEERHAVVSLDSTSLRGPSGKHGCANRITESVSGRDDPFRSAEAPTEVHYRDGGLMAQASSEKIRGSPAQLESVDRYAYHEPFTGTDPSTVFQGFLTIGHNPPWTGTLTGTHYRLENATTPHAGRYMYLASLPGRPDALTQGTVHVEVAVEVAYDPSYGAAAGVLFNFDADTGNYLALAVTDVGYSVYVRDNKGLREATSGTSDSIRIGRTNRVTVHTMGTQVELEVNGTSVGSIDFGRPPEGAIGIIAIGAGIYRFEEFTYIAPSPDDQMAPDAGSAPPSVGAVDTAHSEKPQSPRGPSDPQETPVEWQVAIDGEVSGPFTASDIRARSLPGDTLVWRPGMPNWTTLDQFPELLARPPGTVDTVGPPPLPIAPTPTVPEEPADTTEYYVAPGGVQSGPLSREALAEQLRAGAIDGTTLVWFADLDQWTALAQTRLAELLAEETVIPAPSPVHLNASAHMRGTWQGEVQEQIEGVPGFVAIEFTYEFDEGGRLRGNGRTALDLRAQGVAEPVRLEISMQGRWRADPMGERHIRLSVSGTTRIAVPELDITETEEFDDVSVLEIVDEHSLRDEDGNLFRRIWR